MCNNITVSVVMPLLNEETYVAQCIESLMRQDFPNEKMEILLVDGESEDKTAHIIREYSCKYPQIKLLTNPHKTVPYAMNTAIKASKGEFIIRLDAHSEYADDYISKCVEYLTVTGADNVGGPMIAKGKSRIQKAVAASYHSKFAMGGGMFHDEAFEGEADTVYLGAFRKNKLLEIGLFDERFTRNQDDELNYRIIKSGGKIFITPQIKSVYYPRASLKKLFSQYFQYGYWKVFVIKKHQRPARLSHLIPALFVLFILFGAGLSLISKALSAAYLLIWAIYLVLDLYFSMTNKYAAGFTDKCLLVWIHFLLHISYGLGFICGIFRAKL